MADFERTRINIEETEADESLDGSSIIRIEEGSATGIREFSFEKIGKNRRSEYKKVRSEMGPLAATDVDRKAKNRKDSKFLLNKTLRESLGVVDEEKRAIDEMVANRIRELEEKARKEGDGRGYEEGKKRGYDEAFSAFKKSADEDLARLKTFMDACEESKNRIFQANEKVLIEIILKISKLVLLKELETDKDYLVRMCKELINRYDVRENITIRIHRRDFDTIGKIEEELQKSFSNLKNLNIDISDKIELGGCRLETEWLDIDSTLERQLELVRESLLEVEEEDVDDQR